MASTYRDLSGREREQGFDDIRVVQEKDPEKDEEVVAEQELSASGDNNPKQGEQPKSQNDPVAGKRTKRLAVLANGKTVQNFVSNPTVQGKYDEVWGLNQQATWKGIQLDRLFVMDDLKLRMPFYAGYDFVNWLKDYKRPIITSRQYDEWPTSEAFPIKKVAAYFGLPLGINMYSTPDYMLALGIYEGFDQIDLFGCDFSDGIKSDNHMVMGTAQWIGAAHARGILVRTFVGSVFQYLTPRRCLVTKIMEYMTSQHGP